MHIRYHKTATEDTHESVVLQDHFHIAKYKTLLSLNPGYNVAKTHNKQNTEHWDKHILSFYSLFCKKSSCDKAYFQCVLNQSSKSEFLVCRKYSLIQETKFHIITEHGARWLPKVRVTGNWSLTFKVFRLRTCGTKHPLPLIPTWSPHTPTQIKQMDRRTYVFT
jgi:hypothetical protein